jgi:type IV secretory pathway TraG/TraD family ATPase VirD4
MQNLLALLSSVVIPWWHRLSTSESVAVVALGGAALILLLFAAWEWLKSPVNLRVLEGVRLVSSDKLAKRTASPDKAKRARQLMFGQVPWPTAFEDKHALIVGTTGVGKSTLIRQLLGGIRNRDGRAIVVDLNGDFSRALGVPTDKRFNPLDASSVKWNPLREIQKLEDIDLVLRAAIPAGTTPEDENWRQYARQFLNAVMARLFEAKELRLDRLRYYVMDAGEKELAAFLQTGSQPYRIQSNNMASTVKSIAQSCVQSLAHASAAPDFSVRKWVRQGQGFIFITPRDRDRAALLTLMNAFMNLAIAEALSAPSGKPFRPIAVVVDELASFDFDDLQGVLEKGRKFGVVAFAGIQNVAQLRQKYGQEGATTLLACFRTKVIFNPGDAETAKRMAEEIGRQVVERRQISHSRSAGNSSTSESWHREDRYAVSPESLQALPDLSAYLKIGGDFEVAKINLARGT